MVNVHRLTQACILLAVLCALACSATEVGEHRRRSGKVFQIDELWSRHPDLREGLLARGWRENTNHRRRWDFKWTFSFNAARVQDERQIVNHFPDADDVCSKSGLLRTLTANTEAERTYAAGKARVDADEIAPRAYLIYNRTSWQLDDTRAFQADFAEGQAAAVAEEEHASMMAEEERRAVGGRQPRIDGERNVWIVKPANQARGVGVELFSTLAQLDDYLRRENDKQPFVVQKYMEKVHLINGTKYDMRQFVLVTSLRPLTVWQLDDRYLRFCSTQYDLDSQDKFVHLTNHQVQKESTHKSDIPFLQWSGQQFVSHVGQEAWARTQESLRHVIISALLGWNSSHHRDYSFQLLGFDVLFDRQLQPWLVEINCSPGTHLLTDVVRKHHPYALQSTLDLIIDSHDALRKLHETAGEYVPGKVANERVEALLEDGIHRGGWDLIYKGPEAAAKPGSGRNSRANSKASKLAKLLADYEAAKAAKEGSEE